MPTRDKSAEPGPALKYGCVHPGGVFSLKLLLLLLLMLMLLLLLLVPHLRTSQTILQLQLNDN